MQIETKNLSFGVPAAERDEDLIACFVNSQAYMSIESGRKCIILGNRGSGKSALFRKLADNQKVKGNIVVDLAPEDYSYELLAKALKRESEGAWAKHGAFAAAWKYLILVTVMKRMVADGGKFKHGPEAKIYNYLRDNHKTAGGNPIGMLISYLKRLEGLKIGGGGYEAGIKAIELQRLYGLEEIQPLLPFLSQLCQKKPVTVLVDELDKGWDASEDAVAFVAGLFQAAIAINTQVEGVRVLVSLRKELYDNIPSLYEDAQKVRDIMETLEWDEDLLLELIARRIERRFPELKELDYNGRWQAVFSETLEYRQTKSFNYMIDRTLYRPREIIQFCNDVADYARSQLIAPEVPFGYKQIAEAEYGYSESRLKDICAEYRFQYPGLQSIMETFRGFSYTFSRDELEEHFLKVLIGDLPTDGVTKGWSEGMEPDDLIDVLWSVGFLRAQAVGGVRARRRSGSSYLGSHQISALNLRSLGRFHVHPMFRSFLAMKESKG